MKKVTATQIIIVILNLSILLLFITCKKYDEDGKRSWHKPEKRIIGTWYLKEFLVDGADSTNKWYSYYEPSLYDTIRWKLINTKCYFNTDSKTQNSDLIINEFYFLNRLGNSISSFHCKGNWSFQDQKKGLNFNTKYTNEDISFSILGSAILSDWTIKKLTDKEMILETYNNINKHLRLKLQK